MSRSTLYSSIQKPDLNLVAAESRWAIDGAVDTLAVVDKLDLDKVSLLAQKFITQKMGNSMRWLILRKLAARKIAESAVNLLMFLISQAVLNDGAKAIEPVLLQRGIDIARP